ncbi:MAG: hypothetical protein FWH22_04975 [Fibromonadales bacterium]|nr:hypothetical protein [Fibromonadales bacterium]
MRSAPRTYKTQITVLLLAAICFFAPLAFATETATPSSLWSAFQAEPEAFRQKHSGSKITISAIVADTHISIYATPVVSLVDKAGDEIRVICVLPRLDVGKLSSFKTGERVKMTGNFYSAREEKIVIKQCQAY